MSSQTRNHLSCSATDGLTDDQTFQERRPKCNTSPTYLYASWLISFMSYPYILTQCTAKMKAIIGRELGGEWGQSHHDLWRSVFGPNNLPNQTKQTKLWCSNYGILIIGHYVWRGEACKTLKKWESFGFRAPKHTEWGGAWFLSFNLAFPKCPDNMNGDLSCCFTKWTLGDASCKCM